MTQLEPPRTAGSAREALASGKATIVPALRTAVDALPGPVRRIAGYHFGWWDEDGRPAKIGGGGKAIRPTLTLLSAEAAGCRPAEALPAAVAVELVHNFSLLHDDVMDCDTTRHHRRTAWSVFGVGAAILTGDALLTLAFEVLAGSRHPAAPAGLKMLAAAVQQLVHGQSVDMSFEHRSVVSPAECLRMSEDKTASLLGCACALGASFGGATAENIERMRQFGSCLGLAFQHVDDLLGIWGEPDKTGKPVYSDLQNRKKSLPVVAALSSGTPAGRELADLYAGDAPLSANELARAAELIDLAGGRAWSEKQAERLLAQALQSLSSVASARGAVTRMTALAQLVTQRDR
ncbi:geranylgeranyl diphosphate synthase, type I [Amycolatopsis lurida]|uniref:Dimethylallyltranstransferase n=1 Tax=Amycolatopsis lurida NRRL 2430 TaxID=1460371 RepID=A0A2P2FZ74_AMYLU|nr:family 2 encapsulin nanocompartment cargo protein polyprenyl transferase [Amycolatopsis lurida]KFU82026.1 dimethylallyltranstransferase [Amycolatopsis lurida NRRL 2430]SEC42347.1 geranylgeranyl diphosphate synthase, type I [Amycolatopsis lurida]